MQGNESSRIKKVLKDNGINEDVVIGSELIRVIMEDLGRSSITLNRSQARLL